MSIQTGVFKLEVRSPFAWGLIVTMAAAIAALALSLQAGVFVLLFAATAWWVWEHPEEGFLLLLVLLPVLPMFKITQTTGTVTLVKDVIILTLFCRTFLVPLYRKTLRYRRNILIAPIAVLSAWSILAAWRADSWLLGALRLRDIGLYILLYAAVLYLDHDLFKMKRRLAVFAMTTCVLLLLGVWQWFFAQDSAVLRFDPARSIWIPRLSSVMAHPSIFGEYLIMAAALFATVCLFMKQSVTRWGFGLLALSILPFIYLTYSRAVWIGAAAGLAAMGVVYISSKLKIKSEKLFRIRGLFIGAFVLLIVLLGLLRFTSAGVFLRSAFDPTYGSNEERLTFLVRLIAPTTSGQAIVGRGLGDVTAQNFRSVDLETLDIATGNSRAVQLTKNTTLVDNQYLKSFVEVGVVGLVFYFWLYWRFFLGSLRLVRQGGGRHSQIIGLWGVGFLAAFIIQAFFIDIWDISPTNAFFWITAALVSQELAQ